MFAETLLAPALKSVVDQLGQPLLSVPSSGMSALVLSIREDVDP